MARPKTSGTAAIRNGSGRRSASGGGAGSWNRVTRSGGSSRGGRLKSIPEPSADGRSAASGGS